ncbi:MAG: amidohydrolase family protein [Xanthobacteraceae bacterium]
MGKWRDRAAARMRTNDARDAWLDQHREDILEPDLPIIDPHHHLWDARTEPMPRYVLEDVLDDVDTGHKIEQTVFLQCASMYRDSGPEALKPVGETEFVNGIAAASASGQFGPTRIAADIVGYVDMQLGAAVEDALVAHKKAGGDRFKGVRFSTGAHFDPAVRKYMRRLPPEHLLADPKVHEGISKLAPLGLTLDCWLYFTQLDDVVDLARKFASTTIILDHVGGLLGLGQYEGKRQETFALWKSAIEKVAREQNVVVKLGGLTMKTAGFNFDERPSPPTSADLAEAWRPYLETCIASFGVDRCMFESNFPVDKDGCSYPVLWNAFKRITANYSAAEKAALYKGTAARVYRLHG